MGNPVTRDRPTGIDIAGAPASDAGVVMTSAAYVCAGLNASTSSNLGAVDALVGVSKTSTASGPRNTRSKSFEIKRRTICAFSKYSAARSLLSAKAPTATRRRVSSPNPSVRALATADWKSPAFKNSSRDMTGVRSP